MQEIAPGIFVETVYPPYNLALIQLEEGALVINAPPRPSHTRAWIAQARAHTEKLHYLALTDGTPEHFVGAAACGLPLIASETTRRRLHALSERDWHELVQTVIERYPEEADALHALKRPRVKLACSHTFELHRVTPALHFATITGTTPGALSILALEQQLLFAGDAVAVDAPLPLEYAVDSKAWLNFLGDLAYNTHIQRIAPGRGRAVILRGEIEQAREFLRVMRRTARTLGRAAEDVSYRRQAQDLGQAFFNATGQPAVKCIRQGLKRLVEESAAEREPPGNEGAMTP